jgi:hypothetical protein
LIFNNKSIFLQLKTFAMEIKYESDFLLIKVDKEKRYLEAIRKSASERMEDDDYKNDAISWRLVLEDFKPISQLVDNIEMKFIIGPDLQIWTNEHLIAPAVNYGLKKVGFVETDELFSRISVQQTMEENKNSPLLVRYFKNKEDAENWLFS